MLLHPTDDFMNPIPTFNEDALFMDVVVLYKGHAVKLKLKAKADNRTIDEENKVLTLNDLKTTSKPIGMFMRKQDGSFTKYHYSRQFAFYKFMLETYCMKEYGCLPENHSFIHEQLRPSMQPERKIEYSPVLREQKQKAFRPSLFDSLSAFFHIKRKAKNHERNNYLPGEPKRRRDQDHYVRQFRHRAGHGREKGAPG